MQTTSETTPAAGNFEAEAVAGAAGARWAPGWLALVLVVAGMLAYANSLNGPLILDDWITLRVNPELDRVWPPWLMFMPSEGTGLGGRPIAHASFVLNRALTGPSLQSMHAGNTAIHIAAALALFGFVRRVLRLPRLRERFGAAADALGFSLALLWLLQPLQTESVTYISQRTESLMGLFYLLTLYAFVRSVETARAGPWRVIAWLCCLAGMGTKEGMVSAPVMVFLGDALLVSGSLAEAWRRRGRWHLALAATWLVLPWLMRGLGGRGVGFSQAVQPLSYLLTECGAVVRYAMLAAWPFPLVFDYGTDLPPPGLGHVVCAVALLALAGWTGWGIWRGRAIAYPAAWFFALLAPTSSIVPIPLQPISENRVYLASAGVLVALVLAVHRLGGRRGGIAVLGVAGAFALLTFDRNHDYRSDLAIWADTLAKRPRSSRAHINYGTALMHAGRLQEARAELEEALRLRPDFPDALGDLAGIVGALGQRDRAIELSRRAVQLDPNNANAFYNLGVGLTDAGDVPGAIAAYEAMLKLRPAAPEGQGNLALLLLRSGRIDEAMHHAQIAVQLDPRSADGYYVLGCGLSLRGRPLEALPQFQQAVRLRPGWIDALVNNSIVLQQLGRASEAQGITETAARLAPQRADVHLNLGNIYLGLGRERDAVREYETTLQIQPDSFDARLNLGFLMAKEGRNAEAALLFEAALALQPNHLGALIQLGTAEAALGKRDAARARFERALQLDPKSADARARLDQLGR